MLRFKPERLGHCVFTARDETLWAQLRASKIPVELCITSNVVTDSVDAEGGNEGTPAKKSANTSAASAAARHHLTKVHGAGHPFVLATDDPGVFDTSLSREYALAAASCGLRSEDLRRIARDAFEYAFVHAHEAMHEDIRRRGTPRGCAPRSGTRRGGLPPSPPRTRYERDQSRARRAPDYERDEEVRARQPVQGRVADLVDVAGENASSCSGGDDDDAARRSRSGRRRTRRGEHTQ